MNRVILMTALILSIVVLSTGSIVQTVEAKKPIKDEEPTSKIKLSCNDRKGALNCKATSRQKVSGFTLHYDPDGINQKIHAFDGICAKSQPFSDPEIKSGTYLVTVDECDTGFMDTFTITVVEKKITSIAKV